jgi:uncharacterized protein YfaP (DUF2135 family)
MLVRKKKHCSGYSGSFDEIDTDQASKGWAQARSRAQSPLIKCPANALPGTQSNNIAAKVSHRIESAARNYKQVRLQMDICNKFNQEKCKLTRLSETLRKDAKPVLN